VSENFEVILFTASKKEYADAMIEQIDKEGKYIHHRVYRDSCIYSNELYIKDLRVLNRDLKRIVIVDNAVISFGFQLENGIPIIPFYDDEKDDCLYKITTYLNFLSSVDDMRSVNKEKFGLSEMKESQFNLYLDYYFTDKEEDSESPSSHENSISPKKNIPVDMNSPQSALNLHKVDVDQLDDDNPGTPTRKMSLTKKSAKEINENMGIIFKCINTIFK
jgi:NLI interacting factor-like phosphatase